MLSVFGLGYTVALGCLMFCFVWVECPFLCMQKSSCLLLFGAAASNTSAVFRGVLGSSAEGVVKATT